jgi:predicted exporter
MRQVPSVTEGRRAFLWGLLMLAAAGVLAWRLPTLRVESRLSALLPADEEAPEVAAAVQALREDAQSRLAFLIGHVESARAAAAADALAAKLEGLPGVREVRAVLPDGGTAAFEFYRSHQALLLSPDDQARLAAGPAALVEAALRTLYLPAALSGSFGFEVDPFGQAGRWWAALQGAVGALRPRENRLWVEGEGKVWTLVSARLEERPRDFSAARVLEAGFDAAGAAARAAGGEVLRTGFIFHELVAARRAQQEAGVIGTVSAVVLLGLLWLAFRRWRAVGLVFVPVAAGCLLATAGVLLAGGPLYLVTLVFGSTLVGVGEDYGLHLLSGLYEDEPYDPSRRLRRVARGLWLALVTSLLGYGALFLAPIGALRQVGLFSCLGLLGAWLTTLWLFPWASRGLDKAPERARRSFARLAQAWPRAGSRVALFGSVCLLGLGAWGWSRLKVDDDVRLLYARDPQLHAEQARCEALLKTPGDGRFFAIGGVDAQARLRAEETLRARLAALEPGLPPALGVSLFVPSLEAQLRVREGWRRALPPAAAALEAQLGEPGLASRLRRTLAAQTEPLTPEAWLASPASVPFRRLWREGEKPLALLLPPYGSRLDAAALARACEGLPGVRYVDPLGALAAQLGRIRRHLFWSLSLGALAVAAVLFWTLGASVWGALVPTFLGVGLSLGALGLAGLPLNLFAGLALALILGMGVDYGIFVQESRGGGEAAALMAISVGAASNLAAFGVLSFSSTPALKTIGLVLSVGLASAWLSAMAFAKQGEKQGA